MDSAISASSHMQELGTREEHRPYTMLARDRAQIQNQDRIRAAVRFWRWNTHTTQGQSMQQTITASVLRIRNSRIDEKKEPMGTSMLGTSRADRGDCNGIQDLIPPAAECGS